MVANESEALKTNNTYSGSTIKKEEKNC